MEKKRPIGIIFLGIIFLILSIPGAALGFIAVVSGSNIKGLGDILLEIFMRLLFIATPIALFLSGAGLLCSDKWARRCAIITATVLTLLLWGYGIEALIHQMSFISSNISDTVANISFVIVFSRFCFISALFFVLVVFYLTRPEVKEYFKTNNSDVLRN